MRLKKEFTAVAMFILFLTVTIGNLPPALGCEKGESSKPAPFSCVDMNSADYDKVSPALIAAASQVATLHPNLAKGGYAYGNCVGLKTTSVLALAAGKELTDLPDLCVGFTLAASSRQDLPILAQQVMDTQDSLIDGKNGSLIVTVDGSPMNLPICLDEFSGGGPQ